MTKTADEYRNILFLLKQAAHYAERAVDDVVRVHGITAAQLGFLNRLVLRPGMSGADLARELLFSPQATQLAIASLERQGLVRRTPDPNHGKILRTTLTAKGRRIVGRTLPKGFAVQDELLSVLTAREQRMFENLLTRFVSQAWHPENGLRSKRRRRR